MKTTLDLPEDLLRRAKRAALERGTSLKAVVSAALERELGPTVQQHPPLRTVVWPPPDKITSTVPASTVLDAIRQLRSGGDDRAVVRSGPTKASASTDESHARDKRSRGRSS